MLGLLKKSQVNNKAAAEIAELERIAAIPYPTAQVPLGLVEPQKKYYYEEIAQKIGFMPAELIRAQLLEFFKLEDIKLYDYDQMKVWLTEKKRSAIATHWCWRPLREKDIITGYTWGYENEKHVWGDGFYSSSIWDCRTYARLVPQHALDKVAKIEAKFGDYVKFFVSDYASLNPDPFIMVRPTMCNDGNLNYRLVFDAWDEPGFGV